MYECVPRRKPGLRRSPLSTTFFLLALGAHHGYARRPKRFPMALVILLYGLGLMAKIGVVQVYLPAKADRYAYISLIGYFSWNGCWRRGGLAAACRARSCQRSASDIAGGRSVTYRQIGYWQDDVTLWTHTLQVTHRNRTPVRSARPIIRSSPELAAHGRGIASALCKMFHVEHFSVGRIRLGAERLSRFGRMLREGR